MSYGSFLPRSHIVYTITIIGFIFSLHTAIPVYSNSSFLELYADPRTVGLIYMAGAAFSILGYMLAPGVIRRLGNYTTAILLICAQIAIFYGLIASESPQTIALLFISQTAITALIGLTLDIFLEVYTSGKAIGAIRGFYTATLNASWMVAPLIGSMLIGDTNNYKNTYVASLAMLFPLLYLVYRNFPRFKDPKYTHHSVAYLLHHIFKNKSLISLFAANIFLQTFYAWMIIYSPIYLNKSIGFSWEEIGIILVVMLIPFPLIQYPLGKIADSKYGEKEIMAIGFGIMALATMTMGMITLNNLYLWALILFISRIGAAAAEIMIEIYFFKKVPASDAASLGAFRITRPLSNFIAPSIMITGLLFTTEQNMFYVIGALCALAILPVLIIRDTR